MSELRNKLQQEAEEAWVNNNCNGCIAYSVGSGKSVIAINIHQKLDNPKTMIVGDTRGLVDVNWLNEYTKFNCSELHESADKVCYVSLGKYNPDDYDYIIFDEADKLTEANLMEFVRFINKSKTKVLALTGTPPKKGWKKDMFDTYFPIVSEYLMEEAAGTITNDFNVVLIPMVLDAAKTIKIDSPKGSFWISEQDSYNYDSRKIEYYQGGKYSIKQLRLFRKKNMDKYPSRLKTAKIIKSKFLKDHKSLIFAPYINIAQELCEYSYHSKDKRYLQAFIDDEISMLACVNGLTRGYSLNKVERALVMKLESTDTNITQKIGRLLRNDKLSTVYVQYYKNTIEEIYLQNFLEGITSKQIEEIKL